MNDGSVQDSSDKSDDAFRTIAEVSELLDVQQHVLRFWETKFSLIKPMKRAGGRRYYRPDDVRLLQVIRRLLHEEGYTIRGVQKILRKHGKKAVLEWGEEGNALPPPEQDMQATRVTQAASPELESLQALRRDLVGLRDLLKS